MPSNPSVSLCMIVRNEQTFLIDCLKSVQGLVDEMVIVDTGSRDQTAAIAESFGARVFHFPWNDDFSAARNESLRHATGDWIVYLDADERLDPMDEEDCLRKAASEPGVEGYVVAIRNLKEGNAGASPKISSSIRMFVNRSEIRFDGTIHERVDGSLQRMRAKVGRAGFVIEHKGYAADLPTLYGKLQRNAGLLLKRLERNPDNAFDLYYLGLSFSALGRIEESIEAFRRALSGTGLSPILQAMILNQLAFYRFSRQEYPETIELAQRSLSCTARQASAWFLLGMVHYHLQKHGSALAFLLEARNSLGRSSGELAGDLGHEIAIDETELARVIETCQNIDKTKQNSSLQVPAAESLSVQTVSQPDLSVCMIVKNEAFHLAEALSHFQAFADEIIIVDTGSTDATRTIARQFTPKVFDFPWVDDFSAARNNSLAHAQGRYVLWLDADDRFQPDMAQRVNKLKAYFDGEKAFYFLLESLNENGAPSTFCYQLRCFPRRGDLRFSGRVHEQILPAASQLGLDLVQTDITVQHQGYMDQVLYREKMRRNLHLLQKEQEEGRNDGGFYFFLALTNAALGHRTEAVAAMESAVQHINATGLDRQLLAEGYLFLAGHYLEAGKLDVSLRSVIKAEVHSTDEPRNQYKLGLLYQEFNRHNQAVTCFERALAGDATAGFYPAGPPPESTEILLGTAYSLFCLKQNEAALGKLQEACRMGIGAGDSWQWLAARAIRADQFDLAFHAYAMARRASDLDADGYCNLGVLFSQKNLPDAAMACYQTALTQQPHHRDSLANLAHLCLVGEDSSRAKALFETLIADGARDSDLLLGLGLSSLKTGDWQQFRSVQRQLLEKPALGSVAKGQANAPASAQEASRLFRKIAALFETQGRKTLAQLAHNVAGLLAEEKSQERLWMSK